MRSGGFATDGVSSQNFRRDQMMLLHLHRIFN